MAEFLSRLQRKERGSSSSTVSETSSPQEKRICDTDEVTAADMSENVACKLELILEKLEIMDKKMEGVIEKVGSLEKAMRGVQSEVTALKERVVSIEGAMKEMDTGLNFINTEVEELKRKTNENQQQINVLNEHVLYQEVYNRRENLRFLGFPENESVEENSSEVRFMERELEIDGARDIEFQRIHRIGRKRAGVSRPIIARFLKYPDRERVFKKALEAKDELEVKVYTDLPKETQESRKKQWPRLKKAREEGKSAYFSRKEPNKLYIEGRFVAP